MKCADQDNDYERWYRELRRKYQTVRDFYFDTMDGLVGTPFEKQPHNMELQAFDNGWLGTQFGTPLSQRPYKDYRFSKLDHLFTDMKRMLETSLRAERPKHCETADSCCLYREFNKCSTIVQSLYRDYLNTG